MTTEATYVGQGGEVIGGGAAGRIGPTVGMPALPEPGRIVAVRGSTWAVADVTQQALPRSPADESQARLQHVVSLQSLDEDRLGEELDVVWELEVGHSVAPDRGLPTAISADGFDDPNTLAAFVDAVRWGAVTSADADTYQSPFRSGANVEAYQLEPLRRALQAPRANLLLADDVGLGKTIEAGLVVQELLLRHRARSVVIVCPPSLALKWQDEMREKFGLEFVVVNSALMADVRRSHGLNANPFRLFPRVIVSMAWLASSRAQRLLRGLYAEVASSTSARRFAFDVLVVDEAHHVAPASPSAPSGRRGYAVDSQRTIATRRLAEVCEHRLFLSATPHNGHTESFTALLEMIDNRRFSRGAKLDEAALREVTVRRLKTEITDKDFRRREVRRLPFTPDDDEQRQFAELDRILRESAKANGRGRSGDIVAMLLKKRFLSSPWAFATTLRLYRDAKASGGLPDLDDDADYYEQVLGSQASDEEEGHLSQPEFEALRRSKGSDPLVAATPQQIDALLRWAEGYQHRPDSRLIRLVDFLDATCRPAGSWQNERVVVFTEYATTLEWIVDVLTQKGFGDVLAVIQGSTDLEERELIRARFTAPPTEEDVRILVATDSAGEGIDLQDHCHRLVNFDIPFNPARLEQRIGRIDRYGQREKPVIHHFLPEETSTTYAADLDFLTRIAGKVATVVDDLGSANQVIDAEIQARFSTDRRRSTVKAAPDPQAALINRTLAGGVELNRRLTELARTYGETKTTMHLTPANARRVVDTALRLTAQPTLVEYGDVDSDAEVFTIPRLAPSWLGALEGLDTRTAPGVWRPVTFDDTAARLDNGGRRKDIVHIHLGHALMQKAARTLRGALYGSTSGVNRVTAVVFPGLDQSCVAVVCRLVLVGRGGLRLHEEVFLAGVRMRAQAMAEEKIEQLLDRTLDGAHLQLASRAVRDHLVGEWNGENSRLRSRLDDAMRRRAQARQAAMEAKLTTRRDADTGRAREIFAAFRRNLTESLAEMRQREAEEEATLFADDQQRQRRRDIRAMEDRLAALDDEERRELAAIAERYTDVRPHVSAAAVVFALTPADAQEWS